MRSIECDGILVFTNGVRIPAKIWTKTNRPNKWFKATGQLYLELENLPINDDMRSWQVGVFYCNKYNHKKINHIFSLRAADSGKIDRVDGEEMDKIIIDVAVTRIDDIDMDISRPTVRKVDFE